MFADLEAAYNKIYKHDDDNNNNNNNNNIH